MLALPDFHGFPFLPNLIGEVVQSVTMRHHC
jgi:hypothetical protein